MATKNLKLNYLSVDRFLNHYNQMKKGKIFLATKTPLPEQSIVSLNISVPDIDQVMGVPGAVTRVIDTDTASRLKKPTGMIIELTGGPDMALINLNEGLASNEHYRILLDFPNPDPETADQPTASSPEIKAQESPKNPVVQHNPSGTEGNEMGPEAQSPVPEKSASPPATTAEADDADGKEAAPLDEALPPENQADDPSLSMDWIREAVTQDEIDRETVEPEITAPAISEKKELTPEERNRVKPAGEFIMDLTKAMLRTGYYSTDHPGSDNAKKGLYEAFKKCLVDSREIGINNQETRENTAMLITGILDEPVNVRTLVGMGMADLFVPKLREYFNRKGLISFALKNNITAEHFENFVDIMSDPQADRGQDSKVGELLSNALVEHSITEISTVFMDDIIVLEKNLPWRVEMAIQRLAKDLKILPMFKAQSNEAIKEMKLQIIQDIIRPLRHPEFLKDLIINCYIISDHVADLKTEDIEKVIIDAFPLNTLLPTSQFIFDELNHLREISVNDVDNPLVQRRFAGVRRILKWISRRMVMSDVGGAQRFLEQLYMNEVLTFDELPSDVQYLVNTHKLSNDVKMHVRSYVDQLMQATAEDTAVLLKCYRRVMPTFMEQSEWQTALWLTQAAQSVARNADTFTENPDLPSNPLNFIFKDRTAKLVASYEKADAQARQIINDILSRLDAQGIEVLCGILADSDDRGARKEAMATLVEQGDHARGWVLNVLDDPDQKWYLKRNALMLLAQMARGREDIDRARSHLSHQHPRVRDEALNVLIALKSEGVETAILKAIDDADEKVRWRAMNSLQDIAPLSESAIATLLGRIKSGMEQNEEELDPGTLKKVAQLLRAMGALGSFQNPEQVETAILDTAEKSSGRRKGFLQRFKKTDDSDQAAVFNAAITALGQIGSELSKTFLEKLADGKSPHAATARIALEAIQGRSMSKRPDSIEMQA